MWKWLKELFCPKTLCVKHYTGDKTYSVQLTADDVEYLHQLRTVVHLYPEFLIIDKPVDVR